MFVLVSMYAKLALGAPVASPRSRGLADLSRRQQQPASRALRTGQSTATRCPMGARPAQAAIGAHSRSAAVGPHMFSQPAGLNEFRVPSSLGLSSLTSATQPSLPQKRLGVKRKARQAILRQSGADDKGQAHMHKNKNQGIPRSAEARFRFQWGRPAWRNLSQPLAAKGSQSASGWKTCDETGCSWQFGKQGRCSLTFSLARQALCAGKWASAVGLILRLMC